MKIPKLPTLHPYFLWAIIIVLAFFLITKKWQCAPAYHGDDKLYLQEQARIRDSARRSNEHREFQYKQDSTRWQKEKDTFKVKLATTYKLLTSSQRTTADLSAAVILSKKKNDTTNYIKSCDSLAGENSNLLWLIDQYVIYADTISRANDSLMKVTAARKTEVDELNSKLFTQGEKSDSLYNNLFSDYQKVSLKAGKKWTVGVGAGYGIGVNGKLQPVIGVTLSRTLIKF